MITQGSFFNCKVIYSHLGRLIGSLLVTDLYQGNKVYNLHERRNSMKVYFDMDLEFLAFPWTWLDLNHLDMVEATGDPALFPEEVLDYLRPSSESTGKFIVDINIDDDDIPY